MAILKSIYDEELKQSLEIDRLVSIVLNKLFNFSNNYTYRINDELKNNLAGKTINEQKCLEFNDLLIQLLNIFKLITDFNKLSDHLLHSLFSMAFNLVSKKFQYNSFRYLDICILNDISECLIDSIGKLNHSNIVRFFP